MGSVYSSSACAFIWLGPGNEESDRALTFIGSLQQILPEYARVLFAEAIGSHGVDLLEDIIPTLEGRIPILNYMISTLENQAWAELGALFSKPWFHRCWTFQEPIRAPKRMIACGSKIRGWKAFLSAITLVLRARGINERFFVKIPPFLVMQDTIYKKPEDLSLSNLIYYTQQREASDPRDKVYALYGLVQAYQRVPLEISYTKSVEDVYRSTVRFCIENEGSLDILTFVSEFRNQSDLPSWVPDWRDRSNSGCHPVASATYGKGFHASSMSRPLLVPPSSNDKLILKGFILAIVEHTIDIVALKVNAADSFPESWITKAAAAGVPVRFLQGKPFQTSYDMTMVMEASPLQSGIGKVPGTILWENSTSWIAAGQPSPVPQAVITEYKDLMDTGSRDRRLILTKDSLGLAPAPTEVGDRVCILLGGNVPFILRPRQDTARTTPRKEAKPKYQSTSNHPTRVITKSRHQGPRKSVLVAEQALEATEWTLIGDCYQHGYMHGEAMETVTEADYVNFTLV